MRIKVLVGLRIRELRLSKRLTQQWLSSILSIPQSTIACWELGIHVPSVEKLILVARALSVNLDDLVNQPESVERYR